MISFDDLSAKTQAILLRKAKVTGKTPSECMVVFEKDIIYLVDAINSLAGLTTNESCGGHTEKCLFPFVSFTIVETELGLTNLAYIIKASYLNNWTVVCKSDRPGSTEGIYYSFLLLPQLALYCDKNYVNFEDSPAFLPYNNKASNSEDVEKAQKTVIKLSENIKSLYSSIKVAKLTDAALRV